MAFGFKLKSVKTRNAYTVQGLFEQIKDVEFEAGFPSLTKHGATWIITFPALDSNNQVWIIPGQIKKQCTKWTVQKSQEAGLANTVVNEAIGDLTDGLTKLSGVIGDNAKLIEKHVESVAKQLDDLGL